MRRQKGNENAKPPIRCDGSLALRPMTHDDIPLGVKLTALAEWNQLDTDWEMLLRADSGGNFVAACDGVQVGTATTVTYQTRFSWIGMVLVDPEYRRRGIGSALLNAAIERALTQGPVRLDATPAGKQLYDTLGFWDEYKLVRMQRTARPLEVKPAFHCRAVPGDVLPSIVRYDAPIFGANRALIVSALHQNYPEYAYFVEMRDRIVGYCLGRLGRNFEHVGPIVAEDLSIAQSLLLTALDNCASCDVVVDALLDQNAWLAFLNDVGFVQQRPYIRMCLGELAHRGQPAKQYAIAGPEIG